MTRVWIIHPDITSVVERREAGPAVEEAHGLVEALPDVVAIGADVVQLAKVRPGTIFGSGKIEELGEKFAEHEIELVLINGKVSPVQQRNLEKKWDVKILDRTALILEIFSNRARTREGSLQVEMAALSYQRTRLVRAWTHLERQRGGLGFVGGPGETQIEADRRAIDEQLVRLRRELSKVVKTRTLHRKSRAKVPYPIVALVGYTNAGKSTLFNFLTGARVMAKDLLFATLDPTMRAVKLPSGAQIILSDTVGFISDLPTELVASFRATLEEVLSADIIVHVRDVSHPQSAQQKQDVEHILSSLGADEDRPLLEVLNKVDLLEEGAAMVAEAGRREDTFVTCALDGTGVGALLGAVDEALAVNKTTKTLRIPVGHGHRRAWLFEAGVVEQERQEGEFFEIDVRWSEQHEQQFASFSADP